MGRVTEESNINYLRDVFSLPKNYTRKDICNHFGYSRSTSLKEIFERQNLPYRRQPELEGVFHEAKTYYLIDVITGTHITLESGAIVLQDAILSCGKSDSVIAKYLQNKYLILYQGRNYVLCDRLDEVIYVSLQNPLNILRIRQKMKDSGYNVDYTTSLNEICQMLDIQTETKLVKRQICDILEIDYSPQHNGGGVRTQKSVFYRNLTTDETQTFESIREMTRHFNSNPPQIISYIENEVEFHFRQELYRVYYL